jgi:hypothetical protein
MFPNYKNIKMSTGIAAYIFLQELGVKHSFKKYQQTNKA